MIFNSVVEVVGKVIDASGVAAVVVGSLVAGYGVRYVFAVFAGILVIGALTTYLFAIETKGRVLEELSP